MLSRNEKKRLAIEVSGIILVVSERFDWLIGIPINVTTCLLVIVVYFKDYSAIHKKIHT